MNKTVIVAGGGWAGCSAANEARKQGAEVILLERTDMLLGTGLVGGIMRNNGRYTAAEEMIAMGAGEFFELTDKTARHTNIEFPGHAHASLYDVGKMAGVIEDYLKTIGVKIYFNSRIKEAKKRENRIVSVTAKDGRSYEGDSFVDATGTAGPIKNCIKYGNGCAMCILRCPSFGGRISLTALAGGEEISGKKADGSIGAFSGSCKLLKDSLSEEIVRELNEKGVAVIPVPAWLKEDHLGQKACQQYALKEFADNLILLDTGHAKLMTPYYILEKLRQVPGFENARYEDPYAGGKGNSVRFLAMAKRENSLLVKGIENLFCAGEKAGLLVGHTEAIVTGALAGYNGAKMADKEEIMEFPQSLAVGDAIAYVGEQMQTKEGLTKKYTFSGSVYFERMKEKNLYTTDKKEIEERVKKAGMYRVFAV